MIVSTRSIRRPAPTIPAVPGASRVGLGRGMGEGVLDRLRAYDATDWAVIAAGAVLSVAIALYLDEGPPKGKGKR